MAFNMKYSSWLWQWISPDCLYLQVISTSKLYILYMSYLMNEWMFASWPYILFANWHPEFTDRDDRATHITHINCIAFRQTEIIFMFASKTTLVCMICKSLWWHHMSDIVYDQNLIEAYNDETNQELLYWPLWWESTGNRWIPCTKSQ